MANGYLNYNPTTTTKQNFNRQNRAKPYRSTYPIKYLRVRVPACACRSDQIPACAACACAACACRYGLRCSAVVIVRTVNNSISAGDGYLRHFEIGKNCRFIFNNEMISTSTRALGKGQVNSDTKKIRTYRSLILLEIRQARIILRVTVSLQCQIYDTVYEFGYCCWLWKWNGQCSASDVSACHEN